MWKEYRDNLDEDKLTVTFAKGCWNRLHGDGKSTAKGTLRAWTINSTDDGFQVKLEYDNHLLFHQKVERIPISERSKQAAAASEKIQLEHNSVDMDDKTRNKLAELDIIVFKESEKQIHLQKKATITALKHGMEVRTLE
jgi:hypothetical protein